MSASTVEPFFTEPTASHAYDLLLQDARWLGLRNRILNRDRHACRHCGTTQMLQVHHRQYHVNTVTRNWLPPWQYHPDLLVTLCAQCHAAGHAKYKVPVFYVRVPVINLSTQRFSQGTPPF